MRSTLVQGCLEKNMKLGRAGSAVPHDGQGLRLVAMTGYGRTEDREAAHAAGFDVHVVKPPDLEDLRRVLAHGRMRPEN